MRIRYVQLAQPEKVSVCVAFVRTSKQGPSHASRSAARELVSHNQLVKDIERVIVEAARERVLGVARLDKVRTNHVHQTALQCKDGECDAQFP